MKWLLGTPASNEYWQEIALALHESGQLGAYGIGFADNYRTPSARRARDWISERLPRVDAELRRRMITGIPDDLIRQSRFWELARIAASRLGAPELWIDRLYIRGEYGLDRHCAQRLEDPALDGFMGIEHASLASIRRARELGKKSMVAFVSVHHSLRRRWLDPEYAAFPELLTPSTRRLLLLARERDHRRDEEARRADLILTPSRLVTRSLVDAGLPADKFITLPLGAPPALPDSDLPTRFDGPLQFIDAGIVSPHKGAHYLLEAWKRLKRRRGAELHFYGKQMLPARSREGLDGSVFFHGSVLRAELFAAFRKGALLIFPTLCDGFGAVVTEAMAHGLPVLTTLNAGAADLIEEGQNGFLVPAKDPDALAEKMEWSIEHPAELLAMRRSALATARRRTWGDFRGALRSELGKRFP